MISIFNASRAVFLKRAKVKFTQQELLRALLKLGSPLAKKYDDTLLCSSVLEQDGNKLRSRFCNNRWCNICNRIRTAKLIKGYGAAIDSMIDPRFVTLTVPNVPPAELRAEIRRMLSEFRKIQELRRKQKKPLIRGIRKLEVTYNPDMQNFHPHFHFIVEGEAAANELIECWLDRNSTRYSYVAGNLSETNIPVFNISVHEYTLLKEELDSLRDNNKILAKRAIELDQELQFFYNSRSWKVIRFLKNVIG